MNALTLRPGCRYALAALFCFFLTVPEGGTAAQDPQTALDEAVRALEDAPAPSQPSPQRDIFSAKLGSGARLRLIDVSLDVLVSAGASSERDEVLEGLQGGGHDPKRRGFTFQQAELSFLGAVDPYFQAETHILASEDEIELEEAFIQTLALPWNLQLEAGYFLTEFGRINPLHPHAWSWLDQPVINTRLFGGEGTRGTGVRLAKILPLPWFSELHVGAQNADGEFMTSFFGGEIAHAHGEEEEEEGDSHAEELGIGGRPIVDQDVRDLGDLVYLLRWVNGFELSGDWDAQIGLSSLAGPNFSGSDGDTWIYGADFVAKWRAPENYRGRPFFEIEGEIMQRELNVDEFVAEEDGELEVLPADTLYDWGFYLQGLYGFSGRWATGLRYEYIAGSGANMTHEGGFPERDDDPFRAERTRISPLLMYSPSEFSRLRLQYNYDDSDHLDDPAHSVWLGLEVMIGAHPAHSF